MSISMSRRSICVDRTNPSLCDLEIFAGTGAENDEDDNVQRTAPILATKVFLYGISDKWKELIQSAVKNLPEGAINANVKDKVFIPQIHRDILDNIISYVYAGHTAEPQSIPLDDDNVGHYLQAARFLEMGDIESECLNYCDSKVITVDNFPVVFKWSSAFGTEAIQENISNFLTEHSDQIPKFIRRSKLEMNISESDVVGILSCWLCSVESLSCEYLNLNMKHVIRQISDKDEKIKLLDAFFEVGDRDWSAKAYGLLKNLCKRGDQHPDGAPDRARERKKKRNESLEANSPCSSNSAPVQRPLQSPADKQTKTKAKNVSSGSAAPPLKIRRTGNNSRTSGSNVEVVELKQEGEHEDSPEQQIEEERESNSEDSSSSSLSTCSSYSSFSSFDSSAPRIRRPTKNPEGTIYFLLKNQTSHGGLFLWAYNLQTNESFREAKLPASFRDRRKLAMVYRSNSIYFMGGKSSRTGGATKEIDIFNIATREWKEGRKMQMLKPRFDFQACATRYFIYAIGGCNKSGREGKSQGIVTNTAEQISYEPRKSTVGGLRGPPQNELACMQSCRANAGIVALNDKVYAVGGCVWDQKAGSAMSASNLCECYDPTIDRWEAKWNPIAPMKYKRLGLAAVAAPRPFTERIYTLGGSLQNPSAEPTDVETDTPDNLQSLDTVEVYDPEKDSWTTGPPMKKKRAFFSAVYFNERIYALGGDSETQPTIEEFNLETKEWTLKGELKRGGNFATVAVQAEFEG